MINLKSNSSITLFALETRSGVQEVEAIVVSGDKLKLTLYNSDSGTVSLKVSDSFSKDVPFREVKTLTQTGVGFQDFIINDFHNNLKFELTSTGSNKCSVGVTIKEEVEGGVFSTQEQINELNRLVPKFYDDAEVMAETPKKQPTIIEFRKAGTVIRTIQIDYINEIFHRVKVL